MKPYKEQVTLLQTFMQERSLCTVGSPIYALFIDRLTNGGLDLPVDFFHMLAVQVLPCHAQSGFSERSYWQAPNACRIQISAIISSVKTYIYH